MRISKAPKDKSLRIMLENGEKIVDSHDGIELRWILVFKDGDSECNPKRQFELSFDRKHKDVVLGSYIPRLLEKAKEINYERRVLKMHTLSTKGSSWKSVNLEHPSTFETLAMEPELKMALMDNLNKFVKRKEFYKKIGRAWKRGYLLYRQQRSILVIEDIDCSVDIPERRRPDPAGREHVELTLSGLQNFIDGLWSSCGDERIIVFTTNHKDRLDPALLRPGRMDMHIHMSYCTFRRFETLASNYLGIGGYHRLYPEIEALIDASQVTPAQVAEELLKSEVSDEALEGVVKLLKRKKLGIEEEGPDNVKKPRHQVQPKGTRKNVRNIWKKKVVRKRYL